MSHDKTDKMGRSTVGITVRTRVKVGWTLMMVKVRVRTAGEVKSWY